VRASVRVLGSLSAMIPDREPAPMHGRATADSRYRQPCSAGTREAIPGKRYFPVCLHHAGEGEVT